MFRSRAGFLWVGRVHFFGWVSLGGEHFSGWGRAVVRSALFAGLSRRPMTTDRARVRAAARRWRPLLQAIAAGDGAGAGAGDDARQCMGSAVGTGERAQQGRHQRPRPSTPRAQLIGSGAPGDGNERS